MSETVEPALSAVVRATMEHLSWLARGHGVYIRLYPAEAPEWATFIEGVQRRLSGDTSGGFEVVDQVWWRDGLRRGGFPLKFPDALPPTPTETP